MGYLSEMSYFVDFYSIIDHFFIIYDELVLDDKRLTSNVAELVLTPMGGIRKV